MFVFFDLITMIDEFGTECAEGIRLGGVKQFDRKIMIAMAGKTDIRVKLFGQSFYLLFFAQTQNLPHEYLGDATAGKLRGPGHRAAGASSG